MFNEGMLELITQRVGNVIPKIISQCIWKMCSNQF